MTSDKPTNATEAESMGWVVDRHCYPWAAYTGSRFRPDAWAYIDTPAVLANRRDPREAVAEALLAKQDELGIERGGANLWPGTAAAVAAEVLAT